MKKKKIFLFSVTLQIDIFKSSLCPLLGCTYCLEWHSDSVSGSSFSYSVFDSWDWFCRKFRGIFSSFQNLTFCIVYNVTQTKGEKTGELSIRGWCGHKMCFRFTAIKLEGKLHEVQNLSRYQTASTAQKWTSEMRQ